MPRTPHIERHFRASQTVRDIVIGMERPERGRAIQIAATIACAYIAGGLIPIAPYFVASGVTEALTFSVAVTLIALAVFGYVKGYTGTAPLRSAPKTLLIGGIAASAAFALARAIS